MRCPKHPVTGKLNIHGFDRCQIVRKRYLRGYGLKSCVVEKDICLNCGQVEEIKPSTVPMCEGGRLGAVYGERKN